MCFRNYGINLKPAYIKVLRYVKRSGKVIDSIATVLNLTGFLDFFTITPRPICCGAGLANGANFGTL